ncbi:MULTISPECIES: cation diffusion facilitator family transporter [Bacillus amyloliquefaciens group]|uniref:cation diffusion facilitator family transporter n=1 Tax=Bacillus amyloliquefaciens group TaxID=1938374 RepID=UPI0002059964|nr:cation diffusion facilitator family transporter [Bacillus amyloliquefaciens]AIW32340.1 transporter [Bacillus subtilis]AEB22423.1 cation efflux system [Bacillus amyloliquefaciens TA208]AEK87390.1 putative divalent cation efflux transporter [Bacillus amyloliquefaciens XH7]MEC1833673.1 cation diffusion facilitator family transporter [Bacillus amyloliquefaciens]MEC1835237.1 cation diffusion facilitator family transporter [Bacillus amyloliquefaciens]
MASEREQISKKVALIALIANLILMAGKIFFGLIGDSEAVFADGIHSAADVVASIAVLAVIGISNKPPDQDHPFGHGKAEVISEAIVGIILVLVSVYILIEAISSFVEGPSIPQYSALFAALISYAAKQILYRYSIKQGETWNSKAIIAIAYDHKGDIVASLAAFIGVLLAIIGNTRGWSYLLYADAIASVIVAYLIFKISMELIRPSVDVLMEKSVDPELIEEYKAVILHCPQVKRLDKIRAREHGHYKLLDVRLSLDHDLTIKQGHDIAREIRNDIKRHFSDVEEVLIHVNPYFEE